MTTAAYYALNRDRLKAEQRAYRLANPVKAKAAKDRCRTVEWRHANPDRWKNHQRRSYERNLKFNYGLTCEDVARMYDLQGGLCRVCKDPLLFDKHTHVDHDHLTGEFRGLLCHSDNVTVGHLREDPERAKRLWEYVTEISRE